MPFESQSQMRTCFGRYGRNSSKWNCDKWLAETPHPECLPEHKGGHSHCSLKTKAKNKLRNSKKQEFNTEKVQTGPRGGKYFIKNGIKIYLPRSTRT